MPAQALRRVQQHRRTHHHVVPLIINNSDVYGEEFQVTSPLTNTQLWSATSATRQHVEDAVAGAQAAFPAWSATKPNERRDLFLKAADVMQKRKDELLGYMHQEIGAGADMQNFIFGISVDGLRDTAGRIAGATTGTAPHSTHKGMRALVEKVPYGVVLGIGPWYVAAYFLSVCFAYFSCLFPGTPLTTSASDPSHSRSQQATRRSSKVPRRLRDVPGRLQTSSAKLDFQRDAST
jgi:delta 1-pyrroline-5-carboxylate dehydrogenase